MSYNLLDEPWIPVIRTDGAKAEVSIREAFTSAPSIRRISCDLPTQSFAILRVLLAIIHDAVRIHEEFQVEDMLERGIDVAQVDSYLDHYADRFDLFHSTRPFFQVATLRTAKNEASGLKRLISDVPNGSPFLTMRGPRGLEVISPADAARWLVHCQAFDPSGIRSGAVGDPEVKGGKGYPIGPSWGGQIGGVVLHGRNLAETLMFNLVPTDGNPEDRPVWSLDQPQTQARQMEPAPAGPVQMLVWQSRRIRLVGNETGVTGVILAQGDRMTPQNRLAVEHMTPWRFSQPQTTKLGIPVYMPLKHDPQRLGWRGAPSLVSSSPEYVEGIAKTVPSATVAAFSERQAASDELSHVLVEIVGMDYGPQESTVADVVHDSLDFRVSLLGEAGAPVRSMLHDAVKVADECVYAVGRLAQNLGAAAGDFDGLDSAKDRAMTEAWAALDHGARDFIADLHAKTVVADARREWQKMLRRVLEAQVSWLVNRSSPVAVTGRRSSYGFMTAAKAEAIGRAKLRAELPLAYKKDAKEATE